MTDTISTYTPARWLPHARVDAGNPMFRLTQITDPYTLRKRTVRWALWGSLPLLIFWTVYFILHLMSGEQWERDMRFADSFQLLGWIGLASLADKLIVDFVAVLVSVGKMRREFQRENWDLICLTNISTGHIVNAKHALAQVGVWRMTSITIGVRISIIFILSFQIFIAPTILFDSGFDLDDLRPSELLGLFFFFSGLFIVCATYIAEPRWRIRSLTAGSVAVSSQLLSSTFTLLSALGVVVGFWLSQAFLGGFFAFVVYMSLISAPNIYIDSVIVSGGAFVALSLLFAGTFYYGYKGIEGMWLMNARRRLIERGGMN